MLRSAAQIPIRKYKDLQGDSLQRLLQLRLEGKRYLIVDEHPLRKNLDSIITSRLVGRASNYTVRLANLANLKCSLK